MICNSFCHRVLAPIYAHNIKSWLYLAIIYTAISISTSLALAETSASKNNTSTHNFPLKPEAKIKKKPGAQAHSVIMRQLFDAPMQQVYAILTDYKHFPEFMPHTRESAVIKEKYQKKWVKYRLVFLLWFEIKYTLEIDHSLKEDEAYISWKMDSGDYFNAINGSWKLSKIQNTSDTVSSSKSASSTKPSTETIKTKSHEQTGVEYVSQIDVKVPIPSALFNLITEQSVYDLFEAIDKRITNTKNNAQSP